MSDGKTIRVLVAEDSIVARDLLVYILSRDPRLEVVGTASNGVEAIELTRKLHPDVITMDIHMPKMDGLEATRAIMETTPTPVVVASSTMLSYEVAATFRILEAGALAMVEKPSVFSGDAAAKLVETVKLMAEVKVVRRRPRNLAAAAEAQAPAPVEIVPTAPVRVVAMGASTGGPLVLRTILAGLPTDFSAPVMITQHISPGFTDGFAQWLGQSSGFPVKLAGAGERLMPGRAYVAPDGMHLGVAADGAGGCRAQLVDTPPEHGHRPAVSWLFRSLNAACGSEGIAVLLTGMGRDGAAELKRLHEGGALTIAQTPESSVVPGMPGTAIGLGAAALVLPPERIADALVRAAAGVAGVSGR